MRRPIAESAHFVCFSLITLTFLAKNLVITISLDQIADIPNSYILADSMEFPVGKKLPLWVVGLLY